jgi:hypothetical protein
MLFFLSKDPETITYKHITCCDEKCAKRLGLEQDPDKPFEQPLNTTAAGTCAKTLEQIYVPRTAESPFHAHRMVHRIGANSILITPIVVNGDKFAGCILAYMEKEDSFSEIDRILVKNVASMLGASIYNKRLRFAAECSSKVSREMLHSMIPAKVSGYFPMPFALININILIDYFISFPACLAGH